MLPAHIADKAGLLVDTAGCLWMAKKSVYAGATFAHRILLIFYFSLWDFSWTLCDQRFL